MKEEVYKFSLGGNRLSTVAGWSWCRFGFWRSYPDPDLNGALVEATPSRLRCGLTRCEALHSITHVYTGTNAFNLEAEGNYHTRQLQPPPIIDDDLTPAITDTENGHQRAALHTRRDSMKPDIILQRQIFTKTPSASDKSSFICETSIFKKEHQLPCGLNL